MLKLAELVGRKGGNGEGLWTGRNVVSCGGGMGTKRDGSSNGGNGDGSKKKRIVAFTTPEQYATRFREAVMSVGARPLWVPTIVTEFTAETREELKRILLPMATRVSVQPSCRFDGIAFTSRAGIQAFFEAMRPYTLPLADDGAPFVVAALGKDAELLTENNILGNNSRLKLLIPSVATPDAIVKELGAGDGRRLLCPVPKVIDLEEPSVVPEFLEGLRKNGWDAIRVNSYVTRWLGCECAKPVLSSIPGQGFANIDALVFTSTAEVEGLMKSLDMLGFGRFSLSRQKRTFLIAAHGPITALGAQRLGLEVDVVGGKFASFSGITEDLRDLFLSCAEVES